MVVDIEGRGDSYRINRGRVRSIHEPFNPDKKYSEGTIVKSKSGKHYQYISGSWQEWDAESGSPSEAAIKGLRESSPK